MYHFTPALYVAARYSIASAESIAGADTSGWVDRIEAGGGYWFTKNILIKVEYIYQQYHDFSTHSVLSGVDAYQSPRFNGAMVEVSFSI